MTGRLTYLSEPVYTSDGAGGSILTYKDPMEWWCSRRDRAGKERYADGVDDLSWEIEFFGPWLANEKPGSDWKLDHEGVSYDIKRVSEAMRSRYEISVLAERAVQ